MKIIAKYTFMALLLIGSAVAMAEVVPCCIEALCCTEHGPCCD